MSNLNLAVVISAVDRLTRPLRQMGDGVSGMGRAVTEAQKRLDALGERQRAVDRFVELKDAAGAGARALDAARAETARLGREMSQAAEPSDQLRTAFDKARREARRLQEAHAGQQRALQGARATLREAGISTGRLAEAQVQLRRDTADATRALQAQQDRLRRLEEMQARVDRARERMQGGLATAANLSFVGQAAASTARTVASAGASLIGGIRELERAKGELATLGVDNIDIIVERGRQLQARIAGITAAGFVAAAYDIRSGIAGLSDEGVAAMTAAAAVTAKATKAATDQMTSLFATAHGLFKRQFTDLDDGAFGELFAAALSRSVQQFKTTGGAMQQAIESAGAFAVNLGMDLREQLAVLGMMQTSMGAGEAGTALRSFAENAARAQEKLDELAATSDNPIAVRVIDANGMLRAMPEILADLRDRYGETLDALESAEIKDAFGSTEAVKLVQALWGQQDALRANVVALRDASAEGLTFAQRMAALADDNIDSRLTLISQRFDQMQETIGKRLIPVIDRLLPVVDAAMTAFEAWAGANPELVTALGAVAAAVGIVAGALAPILTTLATIIGSWSVLGFAVVRAIAVFSALGPVLTAIGSGLGLLATRALPAVIAGIRGLGLAMMANPIGAIVGAIGIAATLVITHWDEVKAFFLGLWEPVQPYWQAFADWIGDVFTSAWDVIRSLFGWTPIGAIVENWTPLRTFFAVLWGGIEERFAQAFDFVSGTVDKIAGAASWITDNVSGLFGGDESDNQDTADSSRRGTVARAARTGRRLAQAAATSAAVIAAPAAAAPARTPDPAPVSISIHPLPGQDARQIADQVARVLEERQRGTLRD